jgi:hypothetical protein
MTNTALVVDTMKNVINAVVADTLKFQNAANYQYQISFPTLWLQSIV